MNRRLLCSSNKSIVSTSILQPILPNLLPKSSFSSSSSPSSSLLALTNSQTKSISNSLYCFLPPTQNPNNIVDLICSSLKQHSTHFAPCKDIKGLLPYLGTPEISRVLLRCQSNYSSALTFFNWVKNDLGLTPSTHNYCLIVHILAWSRKFSRAMELLCELIQFATVDVFKSLVLCSDECNWDPVIFDMLIKAYVKMGMTQEALRAFRNMVKLGFVPHIVTLNRLLDGLLKLNLTGQCWEIYGAMKGIGIHPNSYTFNILTHVICKGRDAEKVNEFLEKMEEDGFDPDIVTYNTLIDSYCKRGRLNDAFYLYKIMYRRGMSPDLVTYTTLMNGLCKEGRVKEAHELLHRLVHRGLSPDILTYNTLISGYCKEKMMHKSGLLLKDMIANGVLPDEFTCWVLVEGYGREGKLHSAVNVVIELKKFGVAIPRDIYDYLIIALCRDNRPFAAKNLLERMSQMGHRPKDQAYNELISSLCKSGFIEKALELKSKVCCNKDVKPNMVIYGALICCFCRLSRSLEGESLLREMIELRLNPDTDTCRTLINGLCKEGCVDKAESLLGLMAEELRICDTECYNALLEVYSEAGDVAKLTELHDRMRKMGHAPNRLTLRYMIDGVCNAKRLEQERVRLFGGGIELCN